MLVGLLVAASWPSVALASTAPQFSTGPVGGSAGQPLAVQPVVWIENGNVLDAGTAGTITVALQPFTGTQGATLTCTGIGPGGLTFPVVAGVATATGCTVNVAGVGYVMTAVYSAGGIAFSEPFTVVGALSQRLVFVGQPSGGAPGTVWGGQPLVAIQDSSGAPVVGSTAKVALAITPGTGTAGATLGCGNSLAAVAVNGVATFVGCSIDRIGGGYTLTATAPGIAAATSASFAIATAGAAARVSFTTQPARGAPGIAFASQPVVAVQDANGNTVTSSQTFVALALRSNPAGGTLYCAGNPRATFAGATAFVGCSIDRGGVGFTLAASASGLTGAVSAPFDVADRLAFATQPIGGAPGSPFSVQPVVAVMAGSDVAVHDQGTAITLSIPPGSGPGGANLACTGGLTVIPVNGLATFTGCSIDRASGGSSYQLQATASNLAAAISSDLVVGGVGTTTLTLVPSTTVITWGATVVLTARFSAVSSGRPITLLGARDGVTFTPIATLTTGADGTASFPYRPATNLYYKAVFSGASDAAPTTSTVTRVVVRQITLLRPHYASGRTVARGSLVTFSTVVRPIGGMIPPARVTFFVYRHVSGGWLRHATATVTAGTSGVAILPWTFTAAGSWSVRSMAQPTPYNANSVVSAAESIMVP